MEEYQGQENEALLIALFKAYFDARKNKRGNLNQLKFEINFETNIYELYQEIQAGTYKVLPGIAFIIYEPLKREILAADFRDRVVHHLIFNLLNPIFDPLFIEESFSCRKGKGTSKGVNTLKNAISGCSEGYTKDCYILKLDISGYFMSINKKILREIIFSEIIKSSHLTAYWKSIATRLVAAILDDDPTTTCIIKGSKKDWEGLPVSKSLFHSPKGYGLPIGNLTSQLFSNIYLNSFDHFMKEELGIRYYGRYVDDFYTVHQDKKFLLELIPKIQTFLWQRLELKLHPRKIYFQHYSKGVKFLGAIVRPGRTYISNRTKVNFYKKMRYWRTSFSTNEPTKADLHKFRACLNSYLGLMQPHRTFNIRKRILFAQDALIFLKYGYLSYAPHKRMKYTLYKRNK